MKAGRCFNCLRKGHMGRRCRSSAKCQQYKGRHHTSICESRPPSSVPGKIPDLADPQPQDSTLQCLCILPPQLPARCVPIMSTLFFYRQLVVSYKIHNTHRISLRSTSCWTVAVRNLTLPSAQGTSSDWIHLGSSSFRLPPLDLREKWLSCGCKIVSEPMALSLYVDPTICEPLTSQPISACVQQSQALSGLYLADHSDGSGSLPVDMLLGSDYYWSLVTGSVCNVKWGPTAVHTKLRWVLSEPMSARSLVTCSVNLNTFEWTLSHLSPEA